MLKINTYTIDQHNTKIGWLRKARKIERKRRKTQWEITSDQHYKKMQINKKIKWMPNTKPFNTYVQNPII